MENKNHIIIINGSPRRSKNCSKIIDNITKKLDTLSGTLKFFIFISNYGNNI